MRARETILITIDVVVYIFLICFVTILLLKSHEDDWIVWWESLMTFILSWMAPINLLSMRHILKSVKSLERHGIYENWLIMRLYGLFWITGFVTMIVDLVLLIYARDDSLSQEMHLRC